MASSKIKHVESTHQQKLQSDRVYYISVRKGSDPKALEKFRRKPYYLEGRKNEIRENV